MGEAVHEAESVCSLDMAVVSDDHADDSLCAEHLVPTQTQVGPRLIAPQEVREHANNTDFWAVIDGYVVDATAFVDSHPGGKSKLLSTDSAATGATGQPFGF